MTRRLRLIRAAGILTGIALILAGCMQLNMSLTVNTDDTIDGQLLLTADKSIVTSNNTKTLEQGFADLRQNIPKMPEGQETVYQDATRYGSLISYNHTPLSKFNSESIKLVKNNGTYRFTLPLDPKLYGGKFATADPKQQAVFMTAMEFEIQVTFPGRVLDSNGSEVGTTVTWQVKSGAEKPVQLFATAEIPAGSPQATSSASAQGGGGGFPWLLIIGGAVVLAIAAVAVFLLMRRSSGASATGPAPAAGDIDTASAAPPPGAG
jgi:hypothetical protein